MIGDVASEHPELAFDFALAHRTQVDTLIDSTSRARYYPHLAAGSSKLETVAKIEAYADTYLAPTSRRDAETAISTIKTRVTLRERRVAQIAAWLKRHKN